MTSWYVFSESSDEAVGKVEKGDYMSNDPVTVYDARGHIVGHSEYDSSDHMWKVYDSRGNYMGRYDDWLYDTFYDAHDRPVGSMSIGSYGQWQSLARPHLFEADGRTKKKVPLGHINLADGNDPLAGVKEATAAATLLLLL